MDGKASALTGMVGLGVALVALAGCRADPARDGAEGQTAPEIQGRGRSTTVDTTKDVYEDSEAPKVLVYVENGVAEEIPWEKVPPESRWLTAWNEDGTYKHRVPVVRVEMTSTDKQGKPVPSNQGWEVNGITYGLNPKYVVHSYYGNAH